MVVRARRAEDDVFNLLDEFHDEDTLQVNSLEHESSESSVIDLTNSNDCCQEVQVQAHHPVDQNPKDNLSTDAANMISVLSSTMRHIKALIQKRSTERVASAILESSNSATCECPVCRETLYASTSCSTLCGHIFHAACVHQLAEYHKKTDLPCPVCRTPVHVGELVILRSGLPEPPVDEQHDSIDVPVQSLGKEKSELDHMLTRTLGSLERIYAEESVFQKCVKEVRKSAKEEVREIKMRAEKSKSHYDAKVLQLREDRERIQSTLSRISQRESDLEVAQQKCRQTLIEITKKQEDLEVFQERMKVERRESEQKANELEDMLEKVRDKERRLDRLRQALDARKKLSDKKRNVSSTVEDSRDSKKPKAQTSFSDARHYGESPFLEALRLPSAVNRPPPPRRPGGTKGSHSSFSLSAFVPKRPGVSRPTPSVAKRRYDAKRF